MPRPAAAWVALVAFALPAHAQAPALRTAAEKSDFKETTRHADVLAFCETVAKQSPHARYTTYGTSQENRPLPLLVLSDPPVSTPEEAAKADKPVVLAYANIHAGEVDGKEAVLALARDLTAGKGDPLLKKLVILIAPDVNPDGNEKIDPKNRTSQNGPPGGVGTRANAQGLDLNRDFVKLESPEVRGIVRLLNKWDPILVVDCHTTNGSYHRYTLTYDGPRYPAADPRLVAYSRDKLLPAVEKRVKEATGFDTFVYGNFSRDNTRWETYPGSPRFGTQYVALRNRIALLSESYSYAPFADRVKASYHFVKAAFAHAAANADDLKKLGDDADKPRPRVALRTKPGPADQDTLVKGYEGPRGAGAAKDYPVKLVTKLEPTLETDLPPAYLIRPTETAAVELLRRHGVKVEELREDLELPVEAYTVAGARRAESPFQKHALVTLDVTAAKGTRTVPAGTFVVRTSQPLGTLAAYLLEPQAEDGLAAWNVFDPAIGDGKEYPVLRLAKQTPMITGSPRPLPEDRAKGKPITPDFLLRGGGFAGGPAFGFDWLPDGEHFYQPKDGKLWKVHARTGRAELAYDDALLRKSRRAIDDGDQPGFVPGGRGRGRGQGRFGPPRTGFGQTDPKRTGQLFTVGTDLAFAYFDGRPAVRLTKSRDANELPTFSADGGHVAFVRRGNLYAVDLATQTEKQLTTDGGGEVLYGRGDWVYEEEIFLRNPRAYWWCPDEPVLAFLRFDDKPVHKFPVAQAFPDRGALEQISYPKSGDPNPLVKVGVVAPGDATPRYLDFGEYKPERIVISRVGWVPGRKAVYAYVQNREQTWLDFVVWDTVESKPRKLFREVTKAWVEDLGEPRWLADGSFLIPSERSGWKHLYLYQPDGGPARTVTQGDWEVEAVHRIDEAAGYVYFSATKDAPTRQNLYRAKLDGSDVERLTDPAQAHQVTVAPAGDLFIDRASDNETPSRVYLRDTTGHVVRRLDTNPVYEREEYRFGPFERVTIPLKDGFVLEGSVVKPPDFDPAKKYPVWIETYAGPHAPTVRDGWGNGRVFDQVLAGMGVVMFRVDPRSASGKGAQSAWSAYRRLGVQELNDLEEAVDWICKNPWADASRIGLSGHSYGGFMTAFALTHSKKFAAGIAGAPVTDWRLYDTIYTERYMGLPAENKDGYDASSCVKAAGNLHGRLLLIHGLVDDNVHFQNTAQFVDALQRAGKEFEMMVYPRSRHGIIGSHYTKLRINFIKRTMGVGD